MYCTASPGADDTTPDEIDIDDFALVEELKAKTRVLSAGGPITSSERYLEPLDPDADLD